MKSRKRYSESYPFALEFLFHIGIFEVWPEIDAYGGIFIDRNRWIVCSGTDIDERFSLRLAILEVDNFAPWNCFGILQRFAQLIFVFVVQMTLEFNQWLLIVIEVE